MIFNLIATALLIIILSACKQKALKEGAQEGLATIKEFGAKESKDPLASGKIFGTRAFLIKSSKINYNLSNFYILRATGALMGIYGNSGAETIYPTYLADAENTPLNALKDNYTITFKKGELPPAKALFTSLEISIKTSTDFILNFITR